MTTYFLKSGTNDNGSFDLLLAGFFQYRANNLSRNNNNRQVHFIRDVRQLWIGLYALDKFRFGIDWIKDPFKPDTEDIAKHSKPYAARPVRRTHNGNRPRIHNEFNIFRHDILTFIVLLFRSGKTQQKVRDHESKRHLP